MEVVVEGVEDSTNVVVRILAVALACTMGSLVARVGPDTVSLLAVCSS